MIAAALLLAVTSPAPSVPAERLKPIESTLAIDLFKRVCWAAFRERDAFQAAIELAPVAFTLRPRPADSRAPGALYLAPEAALTYVAADNAPPGIPPRQCTLRVELRGALDQLTLADRLGTALAIPTGRTTTSATQARTEWNLTGADGRVTRLIAITRLSDSGRTEMRLSALLLAPK